MKRTPRNYDGVEFSSKKIGQLLPEVLKGIRKASHTERDEIFAVWPQLIGKKMATYTKPVSFKDGTLTVSVYSSTLYSLLSQHEKPRLLKALKDKYPEANIRDIVFRIG